MEVSRLSIDITLEGRSLHGTLDLNNNKAEITICSTKSLSLMGKLDLFKMLCKDLSAYELISEYPDYLGNDIIFPITWENISFEVTVNKNAEIKIISQVLSEEQVKMVYREFYKNLAF